jgi:hypothetical protein
VTEPEREPDWGRETASDDRLSEEVRRRIAEELASSEVEKEEERLIDEP